MTSAEQTGEDPKGVKPQADAEQPAAKEDAAFARPSYLPPPLTPRPAADATSNIEVEGPVREMAESHPLGPPLPPTKTSWISRVFPQRARREQQLQTLQMGYLEMIQMMRSISAHLERQADTQQRVSRVMDRFPEALDGLRSIGEASVQQGEVLGLMRDQMERSAQNEEELLGSMNNFNHTLHVMDDTNRNTTQAIHTLVARARESESELRAMMERSERRLTRLAGFLAALAFAAAAFGMHSVWSVRSAGPPGAASPPAASASSLGGRQPAGPGLDRSSELTPPPRRYRANAPLIWIDEAEQTPAGRGGEPRPAQGEPSPEDPSPHQHRTDDGSSQSSASERPRKGLPGMLRRLFAFYLDDDQAASATPRDATPPDRARNS